MRLSFLAVGLGLMTAAAQGAGENKAAPAVLPVADFAKTFAISGVALSPDGRTLAYQVGLDKDWMLILRDWDTGKTRDIGPGAAPSTPVWIHGERVLYGRGASVDRDGRNVGAGPAPNRVIFTRYPEAQKDDVLAVMNDRPVIGAYRPVVLQRFPHVQRFHTRIGGSTRDLENPGQVIGWLTDGVGRVKIGIEDDGLRTRVLHRSAETAPWRVPAGLDFAQDKVRVHGLSPDGRTLYVTVPGESGRWELRGYDLEQQQMGELLLGHDLFDIVPQLILAPRTRELLGVVWQADWPRTFWLHAGMVEVQRAIDQALPGLINRVTSLSDDLQRMVILSTSGRDPGTYYQFDLAKKELKPLFPVRPWVRPAQMAEVFPASFYARDGQTIHGYLTIPAGREPKGLPLVVLGNDTPWTRAILHFDDDAQFLANRGYAVLRINARGSSGYGQDFYEKGKRHIGREVQQDITDGTRWAIAQGIADPARIAIMGENFGGYSAVIGVAQNPGLYRCAIGIDAVVDWPAQLAYTALIDEGGYVRAKDQLGDPQADAKELADISPSQHVAKISAPLLLIYGNSNQVSREAARAFETALKRANRPYEFVAKFEEIDGLHMPQQRAEVLAKIETFLARHLGGGAARTTPK